MKKLNLLLTILGLITVVSVTVFNFGEVKGIADASKKQSRSLIKSHKKTSQKLESSLLQRDYLAIVERNIPNGSEELEVSWDEAYDIAARLRTQLSAKQNDLEERIEDDDTLGFLAEDEDDFSYDPVINSNDQEAEIEDHISYLNQEEREASREVLQDRYFTY